MPRYCEKNLHVGAICPSREKFVPLSVSYMLDIRIVSINTMLNTEKYHRITCIRQNIRNLITYMRKRIL